MNLFCAFLIICIVHYELIDDAEADDDCQNSKDHLTHVKLKKDILCSYDKTLRPTVKVENATKVVVRMIVKSFSYEMHTDNIEVNSWLTVVWKDEHLKWKQEDYDNIKKIQIGSDEIWVPDLSIYNRADQSSTPNLISSIGCQVYNTGSVVVVAPMSENGLCIPNLRKYPFDTQSCTIRIGSWVHSGEELNLTMQPKNPVSLEDMSPNPEFKLLEVKVVRNPGKYKCCPNNTFPSLNYVFTIKRYSSAIAAIYIIPAFILILLTLSSLWLNIDSIDRLTVCCANLIIHFLYLQHLWWNLPSGGKDTPLLIIYGRDSLLLAGIALILTIFLRTMQGSRQQTPNWVTYVVSTLISSPPGRVLFFFDASNKVVATAKGDDDATNIVEEGDNAKTPKQDQDWILFAKVVDKLCFLTFFIVYLCMFIGFLP